MRKFVVVICLLFTGLSIYAQLFEIKGVKIGYLYVGPKLGLSMANQSYTLNNGADKIINFGGQFGAVARFGLTKKLAIQPELLYSTKGYGESTDFGETKHNYRYIGIPVVVKYAIISLFGYEIDAEGGVYTDVLTSVESSYESNEGFEDYSHKENLSHFRKVDFGFSIGASVTKTLAKGDRLSVDMRYSRGVVDVVKDNTITTEKVRNNNFQVSATYLFDASRFFSFKKNSHSEN